MGRHGGILAGWSTLAVLLASWIPAVGFPVPAAAASATEPLLRVTVTVPERPVLPEHTVRFTAVVTNAGGVPLTGVALAAAMPGCSATVGDLAPGVSAAPVTCTVPMGFEDVHDALTATGVAPDGRRVTATATATAVPAQPALWMTDVPDTVQAYPNDPITFTITVHNLGNVTLLDIVVTDPLTPACGHGVDRLPPGGRASWDCHTTATDGGALVDTAAATGTADADEPGPPLTAKATALVNVLGAVSGGQGDVGSGTGVATAPAAALPLAATGTWGGLPLRVGLLAAAVGGLLLLLARWAGRARSPREFRRSHVRRRAARRPRTHVGG